MRAVLLACEKKTLGQAVVSLSSHQVEMEKRRREGHTFWREGPGKPVSSAVDVSKQMHTWQQSGLRSVSAKAEAVREHILMPLASV